jgi:hypothetical protein
MKKISSILMGLIASATLTQLHAHPTTFAGGTSLMSFNSAGMNKQWAHYSPSPRYSLGVQLTRIQEQDQGPELFSVHPQLAVLLHRWNQKHFQANLYAYGGVGRAWANDKSRWMGSYSIEADAEDRRYYTSLQFSEMRMSNFRNQQTYRARVGFAPYLADFDEWATWLIVEYDYRPEAPQEHSVTPLIRLFYRNALIEAGSSVRGDWMLNMMIHF